jgi:hypothetical protein
LNSFQDYRKKTELLTTFSKHPNPLTDPLVTITATYLSELQRTK